LLAFQAHKIGRLLRNLSARELLIGEQLEGISAKIIYALEYVEMWGARPGCFD
jgi:hypothetical protein